MSVDQAPVRGRLDKRQAILDAAFRVFAEHGYERAGIDAIAAAAGVAKPTIYNHLGGKENLFRAVMVNAAERFNATTLAALDAFPAQPADAAALRSALVDVGYRLGGCLADDRALAMQRLLLAESRRFPDLFGAVRGSGRDRVHDALAGRLARLAHAGLLHVDDPVRAADQFVALISGDLPTVAMMSGTSIPEAELRASVVAGVDTFLRAFATAGA